MLVLMMCIALAAIPIAGCSQQTPASPEGKLPVVTTNIILADFVKTIGGNLVEVVPIIPPGVDPHSFHPSAKTSIDISNAKLVISNGYGLETSLKPIIDNVIAAEAVHIVTTKGLETKPTQAQLANELGNIMATDEMHHNEDDPHFWMNPLHTIHYVQRIRDGLIRADPVNHIWYNLNAEAYIQKLQDLDKEIVAILAVVPAEQRHLITFHDAFSHFAQRYGWRTSTYVTHNATNVTPKNLAKISLIVQSKGIKAVFSGTHFNTDILEHTAKDLGINIGTIYSDVLEEDVPTYLDMMRFNAKNLALLLS